MKMTIEIKEVPCEGGRTVQLGVNGDGYATPQERKVMEKIIQFPKQPMDGSRVEVVKDTLVVTPCGGRN